MSDESPAQNEGVLVCANVVGGDTKQYVTRLRTHPRVEPFASDMIDSSPQ